MLIDKHGVNVRHHEAKDIFEICHQAGTRRVGNRLHRFQLRISYQLAGSTGMRAPRWRHELSRSASGWRTDQEDGWSRCRGKAWSRYPGDLPRPAGHGNDQWLANPQPVSEFVDITIGRRNRHPGATEIDISRKNPAIRAQSASRPQSRI
ncbi:MAG: hypothetical protein AAES65_02305 [Candidatus Thiodiazotropha sp. (ex. Lucinoma kazani)]